MRSLKFIILFYTVNGIVRDTKKKIIIKMTIKTFLVALLENLVTFVYFILSSEQFYFISFRQKRFQLHCIYFLKKIIIITAFVVHCVLCTAFV